MSPDQYDRGGEALWRAERRRTIDWLEAPRTERNDALRRARIVLDAAGPRVDDTQRLLEANAILAAANLQLKAELVSLQRDLEAEPGAVAAAIQTVERLIKRRINALFAQGADETAEPKARRSANQRANELSCLVNEIRQARKDLEVSQ